ncbi:uncharacterized protein [Ptychodera flava]|uniref:uncharacterized protein n=1 Tax=Ptychodera flava TaxID=63121 RepID=UPI00396A0802
MASYRILCLWCLCVLLHQNCEVTAGTPCTQSDGGGAAVTSSPGSSYTVSTTFTHSCPWNGQLPELIDVPCTCEKTGTMRYSREEREVEFCDGENWLVMFSFKLGSLHRPGDSCKALFDQGVHESGAYWIFADPSVRQPSQVYCEMDFNGGGWLRVYNMMARPGNNANAALFYQSITRNDDVRVVSSSSTSVSIYTNGLRLENYKEVVYGWAPSSDDIVSHFGYYMKTSGLRGECHIDGFCGNNQVMGVMKGSVTNSQRSYKTGSDPNYPHVGIGWTTQQIVWGYDNNGSPNGHWANWADTECCLAANDELMKRAGESWRYSILIR